MNNNNIKIISCIGCIYYYVTWDKTRPKGCKYFGFKSFKMLCHIVRESTGLYCTMFTSKEGNKKG